MGYYDDIFNALTGKRNNPVPASDAILTMRIIEASISSAETGKVVTL